MKQLITGYHQDNEKHWVAELACGHAQHVRHDPPWMVREWVTSEEGRASRIGSSLDCVRCDEMGLAIARSLILEIKKEILCRYEDAGLSGLCEEGRLEAALGALEMLPLKELVEKALSASSDRA